MENLCGHCRVKVAFVNSVGGIKVGKLCWLVYYPIKQDKSEMMPGITGYWYYDDPENNFGVYSFLGKVDDL